MKSARALLFDLDGTLVDSLPDIANAANLMLAALDLPLAEDRQLRQWVGNGAPRLVKRALTLDYDGEPDEKLFAQALPLFFDLYAQHVWERSALYPGVVETLGVFAEQGYQMACVTNKPMRHTTALLSQAGLASFFAVTVGGDSLPQRKPAPDQLLHAAASLGVEVAECVMVGDSANDIKAAQAAGMSVLCLTYGYNQGQDLSRLGATAMVDTFADLQQLVRPAD